MNFLYSRKLIFGLVAAFTLVSCGGGGVGSSSGGIGGTGIVSNGQVSAIGSITVNDVRYDTTNAEITGDEDDSGDAGVLNLLDVGKVVTVQGTINANGTTGTATRVIYNDDVEGPVESVVNVDPNTKQLVVLGQTVIITTGDTRFENTTFATLAVNDMVEVSGIVDNLDRIKASFLEKTGVFFAGVQVELKGIVQNATATTFDINGLTVDYQTADTSDLPGGTPVNNMFVEVKGTLNAVGGTLFATKVEQEDELGGIQDEDEAEIEGFVTDFVSSSQFTVGNQPVRTDASTIFKGGVEGDIALGVRLEVEGSLVSGTIFADEVSFEDNVELESDVDTVTVTTVPDTGNLTLDGLGGITVEVNSLTELEGIAEFDDIVSGDHVEIRARVRTGTTVVAMKLKKVTASTDVILEGPAERVSEPLDELDILGETVDTSTVTEFEGVDDTPISRAEFFSSVQVGNVVKAEGTLAGSVVTWEKVELEDDD